MGAKNEKHTENIIAQTDEVENHQTRRRRFLTGSYRRNDAANDTETWHIFNFSFKIFCRFATTNFYVEFPPVAAGKSYPSH